MLARLITQSLGMANYWFGPDDELDAALILSGYVNLQPQGRYCFQTTYINSRFPEYSKYSNRNKIIFVLRNPFSVIYSMLYNWKIQPLNSLFTSSGVTSLTGYHKWLYKFFGMAGIKKLDRACFSYNGKVSQLYYLKEILGPDQLMVVDYNDIVLNVELLPKIYDFIQLEYYPSYLEKISTTSIKKVDKLSKREYSTISKLSLPIYYDLRDLLPNVYLVALVYSTWIGV